MCIRLLFGGAFCLCLFGSMSIVLFKPSIFFLILFKLFQLYNPVSLSAFTMLINYHHYPIPENFHDPKQKLILIKHQMPVPPSLQPLVTTLIHSVSLTLLSFRSSHKSEVTSYVRVKF